MFAENGLEATAIRTASRLHRDQDRADRARRAGAARHAIAGRVGIARRLDLAGCVDLAGRERVPSGAASASPSPAAAVPAHPPGRLAPSPVPARRPAPSASPGPAAGNTELPTDGKLGEMVTALEAQLGPIESQASLTTIGAVVSSDLLRQALILIVVGSLGIVAWITLPLPRREVRRHGARVAAPRRHRRRRRSFAILGTFFHVEIDAPVRDRDADGHRLLASTTRSSSSTGSARTRRAIWASRSTRSSTTRSCRRSAGRSRRA